MISFIGTVLYYIAYIVIASLIMIGAIAVNLQAVNEMRPELRIPARLRLMSIKLNRK